MGKMQLYLYRPMCDPDNTDSRDYYAKRRPFTTDLKVLERKKRRFRGVCF